MHERTWWNAAVRLLHRHDAAVAAAEAAAHDALDRDFAGPAVLRREAARRRASMRSGPHACSSTGRRRRERRERALERHGDASALAARLPSSVASTVGRRALEEVEIEELVGRGRAP